MIIEKPARFDLSKFDIAKFDTITSSAPNDNISLSDSTTRLKYWTIHQITREIQGWSHLGIAQSITMGSNGFTNNFAKCKYISFYGNTPTTQSITVELREGSESGTILSTNTLTFTANATTVGTTPLLQIISIPEVVLEPNKTYTVTMKGSVTDWTFGIRRNGYSGSDGKTWDGSSWNVYDTGAKFSMGLLGDRMPTLTDSIGLTDSAIGRKVTTQIVSDTISLQDNTSYSSTRNIPISDTIPLTELVDYNKIRNLRITDGFNLSEYQSLPNNIIYWNKDDNIFINDNILYNFITDIGSIDTITFSDAVDIGRLMGFPPQTDPISITDNIEVERIWNNLITADDSITITDTSSKKIIWELIKEDSISLTDGIHYNVKLTASPTDNIPLSDTATVFRDITIKNIFKTEGITLGDSTASNKIVPVAFSDTTTLTDSRAIENIGNIPGYEGKNSVYVKDSVAGIWREFSQYDTMKVSLKQNQVSEFELHIYDIQDDEKLYFKEQADIAFMCGTKLVLKGRIQTIEYSSGYECTARGFGKEIILADKEFFNEVRNYEDPKRVQYDNVSAQTITNELLRVTPSNTGSANLMSKETGGIFGTDYGQVSMRYEYANRLDAIGKLADAIDYDWWISQKTTDDYATDYFNMAEYRGSQTSVKTFTLSGTGSNASKVSYEKDISNMANSVSALGYGDGINQISTSFYAASTSSSSLSADIAATGSSIALYSGASFPNSGTIRIAEEQITYTGKSTNTLTGCTRGANSTTAKAHKMDVYVEEHHAITSPETGSSIQSYGIIESTQIDRSILDEETLELGASKFLTNHATPIERIKIIPDEPTEEMKDLEIGDMVSVVDDEAGIDGDYRVVGLEFLDEWGMTTLTIEVSNVSLEFIAQMQKEKEENKNLQKYMQGATNIYTVNNVENCDNGYGCVLKTYIPEEAIAINHIKLSYDVGAYRIYNTTTANESAHTHGIPSLTVNGTSTTASTSGTKTPSAAGGAGVYSSLTVNYDHHTNQSLCYVERQMYGDYTLQTSRYIGYYMNVSGGSVTMNANIEFITGNPGSEGNTSISNNTVRYFSTGESSLTSSGWAKFWDSQWAVTYVSGVADMIYSHNHGSHDHSIPTLSVSGTSTQTNTSNAGSAHNHGVSYAISAGTNTVSSISIYVDGVDRTSAIQTALGHTLSTTSETEINLTQYINTTGAWHTVDIRPNGTCRIRGDMWNQVFIQSK